MATIPEGAGSLRGKRKTKFSRLAILVIEQQGLNFPVFVGDRDFGDAFGGVNVLLSAFIVDRTGKITARHRSLIDKSDYEKEIETLL